MHHDFRQNSHKLEVSKDEVQFFLSKNDDKSPVKTDTEQHLISSTH